jgi:UDP-N-acetylmuramate dehydrogenase
VSRPAVAGGAKPEAVRAALEALGPLGAPDGALGALTTYRVGGPAAVLATAASAADLATVGRAVERSGLPVLVVGRGSNLLVSDRGFGGIAVLLDADGFGTFELVDGGVRAGAALPLPALARRSVEAGLHGLEWAVGVPGSVGGGVRMNAGGHGSDIAASLAACRVVDLSGPEAAPLRLLGPADLGYGYRRSAIAPAQVVVDAEFALARGDRGEGLATIRDIVRWRREHQPGGQNAGSVFTNPPPASPDPTDPVPTPAPAPSVPSPVTTGAPPAPTAGWLVDAAGLKGFRHGTAEVSPKHANFIQADPGGSAEDVYALIGEVRDRVAERFGVELRTEIRLIGFDQASTSTSTSTGGQG